MAESQRKKTRFLREKPEKIACISKTSYPLWLATAGRLSLLVDGLKSATQTFKFEQPTHTSSFIEELKKNSVDPQKFLETLEAQAKQAKDFASTITMSFPSLVADKELLAFFQESFKTAAQEENVNETIIPADLDANAANQTAQALSNCLRGLLGEARGLGTAIAALKEEAGFHENAAYNEIEQIKEKCDAETSALKPVVERNLKVLSQRADKTLTAMQTRADKKAATLDRRRESFLHRLQAAEHRKDAVQLRIEAVKKKKKSSRTSSGSFALRKYERDIDNIKREVKTFTEEIYALRKAAANEIKQRQEEFDKAIAHEEAKLSQVQDVCQARIAAQQKRISGVELQAATLTTALESQSDELRQQASDFKSQVEIDWKLDNEVPILIRVPVYIIKYIKGEDEERYTFVSPIALSQDTSVLNGLKKMLSLSSEPKINALIHSANKTLQETFNAKLQERLLVDADFRIRLNAVCRASNLVNQNSFAQTINEGLDEIEKRGYITAEEASDLCKNVIGETE